MTTADCSDNLVDQRAIFVAWDWHTFRRRCRTVFIAVRMLARTNEKRNYRDRRAVGRRNVRFQVGLVGQFKVAYVRRPFV